MPRVLVVEGDVDTREVLAELLSEEGFEVWAFGDGLSVLGHLTRDPEVDLLVVDMHLPGLGGSALLEAIAGLSPRLAAIPSVAITGDPRLPRSERAVATLLKPFDFRRLLSTIKDVITVQKFTAAAFPC